MSISRWQQRFENFHRAFHLLREPLAEKAITDFSVLEQEGLIQRFEFCYELGWKTLRDYLEYGGIKIDPVTPRHVIKQAFAAKLIADGATWIAMLERRNLLSHTYDRAISEKTLLDIKTQYLRALIQVYETLRDRHHAAD